MTIATGKAPGRLDFLGGVADYSGSLVLEMPLARMTRVVIHGRSKPGFEFCSTEMGRQIVFAETPAAELPGWVRYPYGCLRYFCRAQKWTPPAGLSFWIESDVPSGMGVSSSAALEVATLRALEIFSDKRMRGQTLAHLAQRVENEFVGAPCGLMDQLSSAHGVPGALLPILCRPDILSRPVKLPRGAIAVGWPSGVKHAVSASPYATARAAAFMGKRILERVLGRKLKHVSELTPSELASVVAEHLPETMIGRDFLRRFGGIDDPLSIVMPGRRYPVRAAVTFPIEENHRARTAVALLRKRKDLKRRDVLVQLGELLYQSHAGYGSMGLGSPETDKMVAAIRKLGTDAGFYGARVSGGGAGGTVVVLLDKSALPRLKSLARRLRFRRDFHPQLLS